MQQVLPKLPVLTMTGMWGGASEAPSAPDSRSTLLWLPPPSVLLGVCCSHQDVVPNSTSTFCALDPLLFQVIVGSGRKEGQSPANSSTSASHTSLLVLCLQSACVHAFLYVEDKTQAVKHNSARLHTEYVIVPYTFGALPKWQIKEWLFFIVAIIYIFSCEWMMMNTLSRTWDICIVFSVASLGTSFFPVRVPAFTFLKIICKTYLCGREISPLFYELKIVFLVILCFVCLFIFIVLRINFRALHMLEDISITELHILGFFCFLLWYFGYLYFFN